MHHNGKRRGHTERKRESTLTASHICHRLRIPFRHVLIEHRCPKKHCEKREGCNNEKKDQTHHANNSIANFGTKRIGIRSGCAFNARNGSWFGGVESGWARGLIGGFTFTKMPFFACAKCAIPTVGTRWHRIACRGTFGCVAKAKWAFKARGVAG